MFLAGVLLCGRRSPWTSYAGLQGLLAGSVLQLKMSGIVSTLHARVIVVLLIATILEIGRQDIVLSAKRLNILHDVIEPIPFVHPRTRTITLCIDIPCIAVFHVFYVKLKNKTILLENFVRHRRH